MLFFRINFWFVFIHALLFTDSATPKAVAAVLKLDPAKIEAKMQLKEQKLLTERERLHAIKQQQSHMALWMAKLDALKQENKAEANEIIENIRATGNIKHASGAKTVIAAVKKGTISQIEVWLRCFSSWLRSSCTR